MKVRLVEEEVVWEHLLIESAESTMERGILQPCVTIWEGSINSCSEGIQRGLEGLGQMLEEANAG